MADHAALDSRRRPEEDRIKSYRSWSHSGALSRGASDSGSAVSHPWRPDRTKAFVFQFVPSFAPCDGLYSKLLGAREAGQPVRSRL